MATTLDFDGSIAKLLECVQTPPNAIGQTSWGVSREYPAWDMPDGTIFVGLIKKDQIGGRVKYQGRFFSKTEVEKHFRPAVI